MKRLRNRSDFILAIAKTWRFNQKIKTISADKNPGIRNVAHQISVILI
jgi:hypothetical protein